MAWHIQVDPGQRAAGGAHLAAVPRATRTAAGASHRSGGYGRPGQCPGQSVTAPPPGQPRPSSCRGVHRGGTQAGTARLARAHWRQGRRRGAAASPPAPGWAGPNRSPGG